ncbi:unnamed protein product, partial [Rotaria magnacalcarata]
VNNIIADPKSSSIWKSILVKRQFILGTLTNLFKMIPSKLFNEDARLKLLIFLFKKYCSPADPAVSLTLADFNIDIED